VIISPGNNNITIEKNYHRLTICKQVVKYNRIIKTNRNFPYFNAENQWGNSRLQQLLSRFCKSVIYVNKRIIDNQYKAMKRRNIRGRHVLITLFLMLSPVAVKAVPVITGFTPASGAVGSIVLISGSGFNTTPSNNAVYFGTVRATVTACSNNLIAVTVPGGATNQYLSVTNIATGLTGYSSKPFITTFDCGGKIESTSFTAIPDFQSSSTIQNVEIGDFDNDGKPDLAIASYYSNLVSVYPNISTTSAVLLGPKVDFVAGINPSSITIQDLDGDGKLDMAVCNKHSNTISVFRNTSNVGLISFAPRVDLITSENPYSITVNDFNGDGKPDFAVACYGSSVGLISVHMNTGVKGIISFAPKVDFAAGIGTDCLATGDIDLDGKPDLVATNQTSNTLSVLKNTCYNGVIDVNSFAAKVDFSTSESPYDIVIADFDDDGKPDIAIGKSPVASAVSVFKNICTPGTINSGTFAPKVDFPTGTCPNSISAGDVDGDGKIDIAITYYEFNKVALFKNTTTPGVINSGSFAARVEYPTGSIPNRLVLCDLNLDNRPDMSVTNFTNGVASIFQNNIMTCPYISSISPGSAGEGETVTITGTNFTGTAYVSFGDVSATSFEVVSSDIIKAVVGSGATGDVSVTTFYGTGTYPGFKFRDVQSISFNPLADKIYGDGDFDPGAIASSGLPVAYSSSNTSVATIVSNKVHIVGQGNCTIYADQPGNDYFLSAQQASQSLKVNKKELSVTGASVVTKYYDATTDAAISGATLSGRVGSDDVILENTTTGVYATANAGTNITVSTSMTISGTASGNYTLTQPSLKGVIAPKEIVITPKNGQGKVYGETDPALTYTYAPALLGTDVITGTLSRVSGESVNSYSFTTGSLTAGNNYSLSVDPSVKFIITKKPVTVTVDQGQYKMMGNSDPVFTYSFTPALVSGDSFTGSLERSAGETAGSYPINAGTLSLGPNYNITFVLSTFVILNPDIDPPVVTFPNITGRPSVHVFDKPMIYFSEIVLQVVSNLSDAIILKEGGKNGTTIPFTIFSSDLSPVSTQPQIIISADFKCGTTYYLAVVEGSFTDRADNNVLLTEITFITDQVPDKPVLAEVFSGTVNHLCPFTDLNCSNIKPGMTYIWQKDGTDLNTESETKFTLPENASGVYNLRVVDNTTTCQNKSDNYTISEYSIVKPVIYEKKKSGTISILIVDNSSHSFSKYKWTYADGSALPSGLDSENQFLVLSSADMNGNYRVLTTDNNGCQNESESKSVTLKKATVSLYPTLNNGSFKVSFFHPENGEVRIRILNASGVIIKELSYHKSDVNEIFDIELNNVISGVYMVELQMNDFTNVSQVVIRR